MRGTILSLMLVVMLGGFSSVLAQEKILVEDAPEAIRALLTDKYAKYRVASVKLKKEKNEYAIELEKGERVISLVLDKEGAVLSKTKGRSYSFDGTETPVDNDGPTVPSMGF